MRAAGAHSEFRKRSACLNNVALVCAFGTAHDLALPASPETLGESVQTAERGLALARLSPWPD